MPVKARTEGGASVQAVGRTTKALELLADAPNGVSVAELARALGSDNSVASRLLSSLQGEGYVVREEDSERFELSLKLMAVAFRYTDRLGFPGMCLPILRGLSEETGEPSQLGMVEGDTLVYVANAPGRQRLSIAPTIGREAALHATASGKAWLAFLPEEEALKLALNQGLTAITPRTIISAQKLLEDLEGVRKRGYATVDGEFTEGVVGVAAPIGRERFGHVVGTVVLSWPERRGGAHFADLAPRTIDAARELEASWPTHLVPTKALERPVRTK